MHWGQAGEISKSHASAENAEMLVRDASTKYNIHAFSFRAVDLLPLLEKLAQQDFAFHV